MPDERLLLVFRFPNDAGKYFYRDENVSIVDGIRIKKPIFTVNLREAHRFHPESAVAFRDHYAALFQKDGVSVHIEDNQGVTKFPKEAPSPAPEPREISWFSPDDLEADQLGFIVRPGFRPEGAVWFVKASDHPVLDGRILESAFGKTPDEAVERARQLWGSLVQPIPSPRAAQKDEEESQRILKEFAQSEYGPGPQPRLRPGDIR